MYAPWIRGSTVFIKHQLRVNIVLGAGDTAMNTREVSALIKLTHLSLLCCPVWVAAEDGRGSEEVQMEWNIP